MVINKKTKRLVYLIAVLIALLNSMGVQQITGMLSFSIGPVVMKFILALALAFLFFEILKNKVI